ncbi:MAG: hypothetical protein E7643_06945 [Ruminococcaceae bacterium]|nr:hypothetical protein [Oscillospiraceae bacterium]
MKEINYEFRKRYSIVHRDDRRDYSKQCPEGYVEVTSDWCITLPDAATAVLRNAARDLEDYFFVSMGISLKVIREGEWDGKQTRIAYGVDPSIKAHSYRFAVAKKEIVLCGTSDRMAAQAGYFLEDVMNLCEGPFAEICDTVRTSLFNPRMVHSGYGLDMYPTEHLLNIAHSGISSILVFVNDVDITPHGYHDFNDLCHRASQYGIDVYAYSYLANKLHPDDEGAEEFYEKLYGSFFDRCPGFRGIVFVGESCEFPSKDEHSKGIRRLDNKGPDGKPIVNNNKPHPGWYPCYDYKDLMEMISGIIRKRQPDCDIVFWSYNWSRADAQARKALIDTLPKDITLQATFEMGTNIERDGFLLPLADYNLYFPGPGFYFTSEAEFAKENGLRFYSMTNTGGLTWDVGVVPYEPAPYQWMKRYEGMIEAHERLGLSGTMDSHHFGFSPSFISDLAKWAFHYPRVDLEEKLKCIVTRDFAQEYADEVCQAMKLWSDAIGHMIPTNNDQYSPCRMGPAYPFVLFENADVEIPTVPYAHFGGNKICYPVYAFSNLRGEWFSGLIDTEEERARFDYQTENFKQARDLFNEGCEIVRGVIEKIPERKRENAMRIWGVAKFMANTAETASNIREFFKLKRGLEGASKKETNRMLDELTVICRRELDNARATVPLVEFDSRLGYEPSMEYMCDAAHLEWKIGLLCEVIEKEIPSLYQR